MRLPDLLLESTDGVDRTTLAIASERRASVLVLLRHFG
jgi:hypothetical protein